MYIKVSVIIPIYGTYEYLRKCLDSIINQTLKDIEIILVNDASPYKEDEEICLEYRNIDSRIIYIKNDINKGLGETRNTGIKLARGKYIGFVDSDDWIEKDMYKIMFNECERHDLNIIQCNTKAIYPNGKEHIYLKIQNDYTFNENFKILSSFFKSSHNFLNPSCCNKLFSKKFILDNSILFEKKIYYEDVYFLYQSLIKINKIKLLKERYYNVFLRPKSISREIVNKNISDFFKIFIMIKKILLENTFYQQLKPSYNFYCKERIFFLLLKSNNKELIKTFKYEFYKNEFSEDIFFTLKIKLVLFLKKIGLFNILKYFWRRISSFIKWFQKK